MVWFAGGLLLFGGKVDDVRTVAETWLYRDARWTQLEGRQPPKRKGAQAVAIEGGDAVVLFGGSHDKGLRLDWYEDAWRFDGVQWSELDGWELQRDEQLPISDQRSGCLAMAVALDPFRGHTYEVRWRGTAAILRRWVGTRFEDVRTLPPISDPFVDEGIGAWGLDFAAGSLVCAAERDHTLDVAADLAAVSPVALAVPSAGASNAASTPMKPLTEPSKPSKTKPSKTKR